MNIWVLAAIPLSVMFFLLSLKRGWWLMGVPALVLCIPIFLDPLINEYVRISIIIYFAIVLIPTIMSAFDF